VKLVLLGDGESPHLLKWARALAPRLDLYAASSRGFSPALAELLPAERRLALDTRPNFAGGNVAVLRSLPRLAHWLRALRPDWVHAHYLTSHGTLAWLAQALWQVPGRIAGSAWGSDILVAPQRSAAVRWLTRRVLRACTLCTSDSLHMAERMKALGAREVMSFPFGLETLPEAPGAKQEQLFFANRGLEPIYAPQRVLAVFGHIARRWPQAELIVANDGSQRPALEQQVRDSGLGGRVRFVGRLDAEAQARCYRQAR
jgi:glycosyltransferase involved in cell wall biosynthesis